MTMSKASFFRASPSRAATPSPCKTSTACATPSDRALSLISSAVFGVSSTTTAAAAPFDRSSKAIAPDPPKRSRSRACASRGRRISARLLRSRVSRGRVSLPSGVCMRLPRNVPEVMVMEPMNYASCLLPSRRRAARVLPRTRAASSANGRINSRGEHIGE